MTAEFRLFSLSECSLLSLEPRFKTLGRGRGCPGILDIKMPAKEGVEEVWTTRTASGLGVILNELKVNQVL